MVEDCQVDTDCIMVRGYPDGGSFYTETSDCSTRCLTKTYFATKEAQEAMQVCKPNSTYDTVECMCENKKCIEL